MAFMVLTQGTTRLWLHVPITYIEPLYYFGILYVPAVYRLGFGIILYCLQYIMKPELTITIKEADVHNLSTNAVDTMQWWSI